MPGPNEVSNGHAAKFQLVSKSSYPELKEILKKRLPISAQLYNAVELAKNADIGFVFYAYNGIVNQNALLVGNGTMQVKETDAGTMLNFLSAPNPESVTAEFAKDFVTHFTRSDRNLSYAAERSTSPLIIQALLNQGHIVEIRACEKVVLTDGFVQPTLTLPPNCVLKSLEPEDAFEACHHWTYGTWSRPEYYTRNCIAQLPSAAVYSTETNEIMCSAMCYTFGSIGMLYTPEKFRGKGLGKVVMQEIIRRYLEKGLIPITGVEPRNSVSKHLMAQVGLEVTHAVDFMFTK